MALSDDLRERVVEAVVEGGMSRNAAAKRFGISIASAVRWVARFKAKGEISPAPTGGDRRSGRIEAHRDYLLDLVRRRPDMTLLEIQERLIANCGERFSSSVLWRFFDRHEITFKKPVAGRGPPVAAETGLLSCLLERSGRWISGGGNPVKKRGPWAVAHLRVVTPFRRSRSGS